MSTDAEWIATQLAEAVRAFQEGRRDAILPLIDAVLDRRPNEPAALELGAQLAQVIGDHPRTVRYLALSWALAPHRSSRRMRLASALHDAGKHRAARDVLTPLLATQPDSRPALRLLLQCAEAEGDDDLLDATLERLAQEPHDKAFVLFVAHVLRDEGDYARAISWLDRGWGFEEDPRFVLRRARILYVARRYSDAEPAFQRAAELAWNDSETRAEALLFLSRIRRHVGDISRSLEFAADVFGLAPDNVEVAANLYREELRRRDHDAAAEIYHRHAEASPGSPALTWMLARRKVWEGDVPGAFSLYEDAIRSEPKTEEHHWRYADLLVEQGHYEPAAAVLATAASLHPDSSRIFTRELRVLNSLNRPPIVVLERCDQFLRRCPSDPNARLQRANALVSLGRREEALEDYLWGTRHAPRNVNFWRSAVRSAMSLTRNAQARGIVADARKVFSRQSPTDLANFAEVAEVAGMFTDALAAARNALALDPRDSRPREVIARLSMQEGDLTTAWEHLLFLQSKPARSRATIEMAARTAAAMALVPPRPDSHPTRYPDALFAPAVALSPSPFSSPEPRVMHVTSSLASGGAERQVALTVAALAADSESPRPELVVDGLEASLGRDFFLPIVKHANVPIHVLRDEAGGGEWREALASDSRRRDAVTLLACLPADARHLALKLYTLFTRNRPSVVHLWQDMICVAGGLAAVLAGVPRIILGVRSTRPVEQQRARYYFRAAYEALLSRPGVTMVANSRNGADDYAQWLGRQPQEISVVHNGFALEELRRRASPATIAAVRAELGVPPTSQLLGGVMRLSFEKRPELWLETAIRLLTDRPNAHAVLVGDGPMRPELEDRVVREGWNARIHVVGRKSPIEPWMGAMATLLLTSITEGLPNVLIEAQALGTPVVTVSVGGAPEALAPGVTGALVDQANPVELAAAVSAVLDDGSGIGLAGRRWANRFDIARTAAAYRDIYSSDAGTPRPDRSASNKTS